MYKKEIQFYIYIYVYVCVYIYIYIYQIVLPIRLLQNIEQGFLCYTVDPCWLSILNIALCTYIQQNITQLLKRMK